MKEAYMLSKIHSSEEDEEKKNRHHLNVIWHGKDFGA